MKMKLNDVTGNPDIDRYRRRPGPVEIASDVLALAVALSNLWFVMRLDPCPQKETAIVMTVIAVTLPAVAYLPAVFFNFIVKKTERNIAVQMLLGTSLLRCLGWVFVAIACVSGCGTYLGMDASATDFVTSILSVVTLVLLVVWGVLSYLYK